MYVVAVVWLTACSPPQVSNFWKILRYRDIIENGSAVWSLERLPWLLEAWATFEVMKGMQQFVPTVSKVRSRKTQNVLAGVGERLEVVNPQSFAICKDLQRVTLVSCMLSL